MDGHKMSKAKCGPKLTAQTRATLFASKSDYRTGAYGISSSFFLKKIKQIKI